MYLAHTINSGNLVAKCNDDGGVCSNYLDGLETPYANGAIHTMSTGSVLTVNN